MSLKTFRWILCFLLLGTQSIHAQEKDAVFNQDEINTIQEQATQLVSYLEFTLNKIGNSKSTPKEKDILINESFLKIFVDDKVQIEDDLDDNRTVPTNKDVQAYLKDFDFFFEHVQIKFDIEEVSYQIADSNYLFFKFQVNRNLSGQLVNGDTINTDRLRFIEINFDDENQDLRIASIYTTKLNEKEELENWWNNMGQEWKDLFGQNDLMSDSMYVNQVISFNDSTFSFLNDSLAYVTLVDTFWAFEEDTLFIQEYDTLSVQYVDTIPFDSRRFYSQMRVYNAKKELSIPDTLGITHLDPLNKLTQLKYLDISNCEINSLLPLRNLTKLEVLDISNTDISTLHPLRYASNLKVINAEKTPLEDISTVANFIYLEILNLNHTQIRHLNDLKDLTHLKDLRFTNTDVVSLDSIRELKNLNYINFSNTNISNIDPLSDLESLKILVMDNTRVGNLRPLEGNENLEVIYCDKSRVNSNDAISFTRKRKRTLVIFESEELADWWSKMPADWKRVFRKYRDLDLDPSKEQLHELVKIQIIDVSGLDRIRNLDPLKKLIHLKHLDCSNTSIFNIGPLEYLVDLKYLDCSNTRVANLSALENLTMLEHLYLSNTNVSDVRYLRNMNYLKELNIEGTRVSRVQNISDLDNIRYIFADNSRITIESSRDFIAENPTTLLIFQTEQLNNWWYSLNLDWQTAIKRSIGFTERVPDKIVLHQISKIEKLDLNNNTQITDLRPIRNLFYIKELMISSTRVTDLNPLANLKELEHLECANNPIPDLTTLMSLPKLKYLDISNIPIKNFEQIQFITSLETLICPGIQIKNLKYLENLVNLRHLEIYNTGVKNLSQLNELPIKHLKCYNTNLNKKKVDKFKAIKPDCEIIFY